MSESVSRQRSLAELQSDFFRIVTLPLDAEDRTRKHFSDGSSTAEVAERLIQPSTKLSSLERIELYNRQYWFRLIDSLVEDFPGLRALVAPARFNDMVVSYLHEYPSTSFTMRHLGSRLPDYLGAHSEWLEEATPFGVELALVEYAQCSSFEAAELSPLDPSTLVSGTLGEAVFALQPSLSLFSLAYPVHTWLREVRSFEREFSEASGSEREVANTDRNFTNAIRAAIPRSTWLAVYRRDFEVALRPLERSEYEVLSALSAGRPLSEALEVGIDALQFEEGFSEAPEFIVQKVRGWFTTWAELRWIGKR